LLPAGHRRGMKDADQCTHEVVGVGVGAEVAAVDGAPDGGDERSMDERAGAFDKAHRAAGYGLHGRNDESFFSRAVDEEKHPGAESIEWRHGGSQALFRCRELFDFAAVDGCDEIVAGWEVPVECGIADARSACDVVEARSRSVAGENVFGHLKDALAVALRVSAGFAGRGRGWKLFVRHERNQQNFLQPGTLPSYPIDTGTVPVL